MRRRRAILAALTSASAVALVVAMAIPAHVERDPAFVSPEADTSIVPAAGGKFIDARPLSDPKARLKAFRKFADRAYRGGVGSSERARITARYVRLSKGGQRSARRALAKIRRKRGGPNAAGLGLTASNVQAEELRVVCRPDSMRRVRASLRQVTLLDNPKRNRVAERKLLKQNQMLRKRCKYREIQQAVFAADNNDTIAIMPGFYTEPTSRAQPHNDKRCAAMTTSGSSGRRTAPSFDYHVNCPNDLSMVAVIGRNGKGECIRCNVHMVGTGARPEDVLLEGAKDAKDPGVTGDLFDEGKGQVPAAKEVGIRYERADGNYLGNITVRNVSEHGVYSIETDGVTFDKIKAYYAHEYGHLSFVTDHLIVQDGDWAGSSDAGVYPGASPPSRERINSIIRRNNSHHNALGLSGSMGSSLLIEDNDFHNNTTGMALDSISRAGHPGFPQNSSVIRQNRIYSNNFDTYGPKRWVPASIGVPIGTGILFGGGNHNQVSRNRIYDNWRRGTMLLTVPDILTSDAVFLRDNIKFSTSHGNRYTNNNMGRGPNGKWMPNGMDFWWDELGLGNCWDGNHAGRGGRLISDPAKLPTCDTPSIGTASVGKETELLVCNFAERKPGGGCPWFEPPRKPAIR